MDRSPKEIRDVQRSGGRVANGPEIPQPRETRFVTERDAVIDELKRLYLGSKQLSISASHDGLAESRNLLGEVFMELAERRSKGSYDGIRFVTTINREEETHLAGTLLGLGFQVRHTVNFPSLSFTLVQDERGDTVVIGFWGVLVVSTELDVVKHFQSIFEDTWTKGTDGRHRLEEIQSGSEGSRVEIIGNPEESLRMIRDVTADDAQVILMMFPTAASVRRYAKAGLFQTIFELVEKKTMSVRILFPSDAEVESLLPASVRGDSKVELRKMDPPLVMRVTMLIVGSEHSFILETMDDSSPDIEGAIGMTTYTKSRPVAMSYSSFFETMWTHADLFEKLKTHERMQDEFINVAAHELRSPVQAIVNAINLAEETGELGDFGEMAIRSANRLLKLTQVLLDVQRIDTGRFQVNKETFDLNEVISNIVREEELNLRNKRVRILYEKKEGGEGAVILNADKERIAQVLTNLLNNAIEFTEEGTITVRVIRQKKMDGPSQVAVEIRDTGRGIDPTMIPLLFSKFATKSKSGSGLGLYIAKGIVDAHGGMIWGGNNEGEAGATFGFSLPLEDK